MSLKDHSNRIYIDAAKLALLTVVFLLLCGRSAGFFTIVVAAIGTFCAFFNKTGPAMCCLIFLPFAVVSNPSLVPKDGAMWNYGARLGGLMIGLAMAVGAARRNGRHRLPFGMILLFLACATISSSVGYVPQISYLKLINYLVFVIGIWLGTQNIQRSPRVAQMVRAFIIGLIFLTVWGSLALIPFPAVSYATSLRGATVGMSMAEANEMGREVIATGQQMLFCGILNQSQALAPILALSMGWLLCDMLFVEKRFRVPHAVTLVAMLPMLYMTRSRVALLTGTGALALISFYTVNHIRVTNRVRHSLRMCLLGFLALAGIIAVISELRNHTMTRWFRKSNDLVEDNRTMTEAFTNSRMGLIDNSMYDFHRNPLFGSGFQVSWEHQELWRRSNGLVFSASIEKGVLPVMVLGETGMLGAFAFAIFLISFYYNCSQRHLYVTTTMFSLLLLTNMGEATFFSPGGMGGILYMLSILGGFVIDSVLLYGDAWRLQAYNIPRINHEANSPIFQNR